jgi:glycosyltransferase involved in cell wall biosynthesis
MSEPRIAFIIHGLVVGGAEKFFLSLVNHFQHTGHQPLVIRLSEDNALLPEMDPGVNTVIIKRKYKYDLTVGKKITKVLDEHKIDTVFVVGIFSFFLLKLYSLAKKNRKLYLSLHSTYAVTKKEHFLNYIYFRSIGKNDKVIFVCKAQRDLLKKQYFFRPKQSMVIYNGINTSYYSICENGSVEKRRKLKAELNIPETDKVVVKVARMFSEKGHQYAIEALEVLHKKHNYKAHLVLVGDGDNEYFKQMQDCAEKTGVSEYIHFVGNQKDVRPYHHIADVFTLTSALETFSLAALEAMSSGVPCSLTNIGGASEMIFENTGLLSQSKDPSSIAKTWFELLQKKFDPRELHNYVEKNYSLDQMIGNYEKTILSVSNN